MGTDLTNEKESDFEKDFQNENFKYGIISKKCKEKSNDDNYIISPNIKISEGEIDIDFSLFGVFDGHNGNYVSKYLSQNINKFFENALKKINKKNYKPELEKLFTEIDKSIKEEQIKENNNDDINNIDIVNIEVKESDKEFFKNSIKNSSDIPDEFKEIDDNELEDLLLFKNLFDYKNNFIQNTNNLNYIGSSASLVLINSDKIITMDLGITKCFLLDKDGNILNLNDKEEEQNDENEKKENDKIIIEHTFNNIEEKKRIKNFNKEIDYESLKLNNYIPASRSFGFFKYKSNELLNENNQIISCIPNIEIFDTKNVDFIFLITGLGDGPNLLKKLTKKINSLNQEQNEEIKYTKLIEELFLSDVKKEKEKEKEKTKSKKGKDKLKEKIHEEINEQSDKNQSNLYLGKNDIDEENILLDELDNEYYKDIIELNKQKIILNKNTTCILIKIFKNKEVKKEENKEENKEKVKENEIKEEVKEEKKEKEIKEEVKEKNEEKKSEENNNNLNEDKREDKSENKINENN